jgi:tetratricopeptide (TPR) repeat protein
VPRRSVGSTARAADLALGASIIFAPLVAGGASLYVLPLLVLLASFAYGATLMSLREEGHQLHLGLLAAALFGLAAFTIFQTIPLPSFVLYLVARRAYDVRSFVHDGQAPLLMPITYELSASLRDAARLLIYGMIAIAAHERSRMRRGFDVVAKPVAIAGIASIAISWAHRLFNIEKMFGLLAVAKPMRDLVTTFVNPNHAAGFLVITSLTSVGLAFNETKPERKVWLFSAALLSAFVATISFSRGGLAALGVAIVSFFVMIVFRTREKKKRPGWRLVTVIFALAIAAPGAALYEFWDDIQHEFAGSAADPLSVSAKLAAFKDAGPMILDHAWLGIGKGSYVSVYPAYKASHLQYTFTNPENILVQLVSDWGLVFGIAAVIGLFFCVAQRLIKAGSPLSIGAVVGVAAVLLQNLADFSFELPGVAIPVTAVLAATGWGLVRFWRVDLSSPRLFRALSLGPGIAALSATILAFATGNLDWDQEKVDVAVKETLESRSRTSPIWALSEPKSTESRASSPDRGAEINSAFERSTMGLPPPNAKDPSQRRHRTRRHKLVPSTAEAREADAKRELALAEQRRAEMEIELEFKARSSSASKTSSTTDVQVAHRPYKSSPVMSQADREIAEKRVSETLERLRAIADRHPANPILPARIAYLAEISQPPDLRQAMHFANRTLFLAPTYADEYLVVGRILVMTGHRAQGFSMMRRAWELASDEREPLFVREIAIRAKSPEEFSLAVPRRDEGLDIADEGFLARGAEKLLLMGRRRWAQALLESIDPEGVASDSLVSVALAARHIDELDLAEQLLERRWALVPDDARAALALVDVFQGEGDSDAVEDVLDEAMGRPGVDPLPFLHVRLQQALANGDIQTARVALDSLKVGTPPTHENQAQLAELEVNVEMSDHRYATAADALDRAVSLNPSSTKLRMMRALVNLRRLKRFNEARQDIEIILRMEPRNAQAMAMLQELNKVAPAVLPTKAHR